MLAHFPKDLSSRKAIYYMKKIYIIQHFSARKGSQNFYIVPETKRSFCNFHLLLPYPDLALLEIERVLQQFQEVSFKAQRSFIAQKPSLPPLSQLKPAVVFSFSAFHFGFLVTYIICFSVLSDPSPQHWYSL